MDRDEKGRFIKGNKEGKGRIKDSVSINDSVRKILATKDKKTKRKILDAMAEQIVKQAIKGDREFNPTLMIQLWNHIDGSPSQTIDLGGGTDNTMRIILEGVDISKFPSDK
jgi:hypothetical protein